MKISEQELRAMAAKGMTWTQVARECGVHEASVRNAASLLGIPSPHRKVGRNRSAIVPCPVEAISRVLSEVISKAASNGANSVSMPDHYVEVAAWLASLDDKR